MLRGKQALFLSWAGHFLYAESLPVHEGPEDQWPAKESFKDESVILLLKRFGLETFPLGPKELQSQLEIRRICKIRGKIAPPPKHLSPVLGGETGITSQVNIWAVPGSLSVKTTKVELPCCFCFWVPCSLPSCSEVGESLARTLLGSTPALGASLRPGGAIPRQVVAEDGAWSPFFPPHNTLYKGSFRFGLEHIVHSSLPSLSYSRMFAAVVMRQALCAVS